MFDKIMRDHFPELARRIRNFGYERTAGGILIKKMGVHIGGALKVTDFRDGSNELLAIDANTLLTQGLTHLVNVLLPPSGGYAQIGQWYIAPFSNDYSPDAALTAATFPGTAGEFTSYNTGSNRLALTIGAAAATPSTGNSAAVAQMQVNDAGPFNIYGAAVVSAPARNATTGKALACVRLDNPKLNMGLDEKLGFEYVFTASDAG